MLLLPDSLESAGTLSPPNLQHLVTSVIKAKKHSEFVGRKDSELFPAVSWFFPPNDRFVSSWFWMDLQMGRRRWNRKVEFTFLTPCSGIGGRFGKKKKSSSIQLRGILFLKWCLAEGDGHCCHFRPDGDKLLVDFSLVGNTVGPAGPRGGWVTWAVEEPETEAFSETLGSKCFLKNYKLSCRVSIWKEWFTPGHDSTNTSYVQ